MKRLLLYPLVLPLSGILYLLLSVAESYLAARLHWVDQIGWFDPYFFVSSGLLFGLIPVPLFVLWDLLRNKRRPLALEEGMVQFSQHLAWGLFYGTLVTLLYVAIPDRLWDAVELQISSALKLNVGDLAFDQGITPYVINAAAILFAAARFVLRSVPASPLVLWNIFRSSWRLVPSRS